MTTVYNDQINPMYEAALTLTIKDFMKYLDGAPREDPSAAALAVRADELLREFLKKAEDGRFSKDDAQELQGMLTKGIGDWNWPPPYREEIGGRITKLCALAYAEERS